jgi:hypothetical protein
VRPGFSLAGFAERLFALRTRRERFGLVAKAFCHFGKSFFEGLGLFETAALHGKSSFYGS